MKDSCHYLVIDDDTTNNLICDFTIRRFDPLAITQLFSRPEEALDYIKNRSLEEEPAVIFLDVNMPTMSGFEFLELFEKLDSRIQGQYRIYMLTSAIEDHSGQLEQFKALKGFFSKPMKLSYLEEISEGIL